MPSPPRLVHHHHRSASVREHHTHLPPLKRSSSVSNVPPAPPVEIGSTGAISALLHRDISTRSSPLPQRTSFASQNTSKTFYVWHNRLWLFPEKKPSHLEPRTSSSSKHNNKVPRWKKLIKKLTGNGIGNMQKRHGIKKPVNNTTSHSHQSPTANPAQLPATQPSPCQQLTSPIWERRNFAQITPLNLSHLSNARLRQKYAK